MNCIEISVAPVLYGEYVLPPLFPFPNERPVSGEQMAD